MKTDTLKKEWNKVTKNGKMNSDSELIQALNQIEKEKSISTDILIEAIENSLVAA